MIIIRLKVKSILCEAREGWIADDDGKLKKLSAFDWAKFKIAKERGSAADDTKIDFKNLSPFFKTIVDEINTDEDDKISAKELKAAMKNPELTEKLSHLICFHQSEWYIDDGLMSWQKVLKKVGLYKAEKMELQLKELCWWREVADNSKLFLKSPDVYHWHPVAFVEQMKSMKKYDFEKPKRGVKAIFLHCSASDNPKHDNAATMNKWHKERGWDGIGYYFFIRKDGTIEKGRNIEKKPIAQKGFNTGTIAICLHGLEKKEFYR